MKRSTILVSGPVPLTVEAADASIDLVDFMAAKVRGVDLIDVTPAVRAAWRARLVAYWALFDADTRGWCAASPQMLEHFQNNWDSASEGEQARAKELWASQLAGMLPAVEATVQSVTAQSGPASRAGYGTQAASPLETLLSAIHARQAKEIQDAAPYGEAHQAMVQAQVDNSNITMLSNISRMRYEAMMNTIRNMKY